MKIADYIEEQRFKLFEVCEQLGVDHSTLWRWMNGKTPPSKENLTKIMKWSDGKVTPNDFLCD
ncbi:XRE family transcriptional regulator [Pararheinheimera phage vB_PsoM_KLER1-1]|nr:XRE family transcriptional regulator [Pararheinheimera phage vB_PsoM_KLER1-1]